MILECKSCQKKFVVPDNAIPAAGRLVQCSSCGNKWTQFPVTKKVVKKPKIPNFKKEKIDKPTIIPSKFKNIWKKNMVLVLIKIIRIHQKINLIKKYPDPILAFIATYLYFCL